MISRKEESRGSTIQAEEEDKKPKLKQKRVVHKHSTSLTEAVASRGGNTSKPERRWGREKKGKPWRWGGAEARGAQEEQGII
jgi:hypothetical protein